MDKEEALMESNLGLVSNGEFLTPFEDEDYPSIDETLDGTNSRINNPSKILNIQIGGEDNINEHEIYSLTISLKPGSYETSPNSISLSNLSTFEISNPLTLSVYKNFKRMVVNAYVYHKYYRSHCALKVSVGGETCRQNLVGSLPRGMPKVVDCRQTGVQATNEMVM
jgi:hypothetical protein